ncbi:unnamed protein product [Vitrella brassicaformis CCMP3155]|uniref:Protein kinase domain-containing protein n=1 Tax=Vitrella brassicaformis (strain CCMP3155) TaxID=1169540 RepID=A0A0G4G3U9_VITBC|nr:unnamed protein product [Vitrella brassicaformis CCMP3155]|eukprot:CEM22847.1 unnamed protein product [Vitrella brassicaformis CCMP3155]
MVIFAEQAEDTNKLFKWDDDDDFMQIGRVTGSWLERVSRDQQPCVLQTFCKRTKRPKGFSVKTACETFDRVRLNPHPNLVTVQQLAKDSKCVCVLMERIGGPTVCDYMMERGKTIESEGALKKVMAGILSGVEHLHQHGLVHRDVKLDNVMFVNQEPSRDDYKVKLIDLEFGTPLGRENKLGVVGTHAYMAPECFRGRFSQSSDIWACGVALYILLEGRAPFHLTDCRNSKESIKVINQGFAFRKRTKERFPAAVDLVRRLLHVDPSKRPSASEALQHSWFGEPQGPSTQAPDSDKRDAAPLSQNESFRRSLLKKNEEALQDVHLAADHTWKPPAACRSVVSFPCRPGQVPATAVVYQAPFLEASVPDKPPFFAPAPLQPPAVPAMHWYSLPPADRDSGWSAAEREPVERSWCERFCDFICCMTKPP